MSDNVIGSLWVTLGLDASNLEKGLGTTQGQLTGWRDQTNSNTMEMARWGAAIAAEVAPVVAIGAALNEAATSAGTFGNTIEEQSRALGLSTDEYQQWRHVATAAGADADAFTASVRMMSSRMKEAGDPTSAMGKELKVLGVTVVDSNGKYKDMNTVLTQTLTQIGKLPDGFEKNQAALAIFGRSWAEIAPMLKLSNDEIATMKVQAPVIDDVTIKKMADFHTQQALVNEQWQIMSAEIGAEVIPAVSAVITFAALAASGLKQMADAANVAVNAMIALQSFGTQGDVTGAYNQLSSDFEAGGNLTDSLTGSKATSAPASNSLTASHKSLSRRTVVQQNSYTTVALTADQIASINKANNRDLATSLNMGA